MVKANATWRHHLTFDEIQILQSPGRSDLYAVILDKPVEKQPRSTTEQNPSTADPAEYGDACGGQIAHVSISHDGEYATAVCIVASAPLPGDVGGEAEAREPEMR